jgi:hypothetical protein
VFAIFAREGAQATTGAREGLTAPKVRVAGQDVLPVLGRFLLAQAPRRARLISARLDIEPEQDGFWYYGEIELHFYNAKGLRTTVFLAVYEFTYVGETLSAKLIPIASITLQHPHGVSTGRISFDVPVSDTGFGENAVELKEATAEFTLNGRGPYKLAFRRISADQPVPNPLPKAKQTG